MGTNQEWHLAAGAKVFETAHCGKCSGVRIKMFRAGQATAMAVASESLSVVLAAG